MNKAVFIDRDGVINNDTGHYYIYKVDDFRINKGIYEGLKILSDAGFKLILVTNQAGIAKGEYTHEDVFKVHSYLKDELKRHNIYLTDIFYCPHHDSVSVCNCRKPKPGMILEALKKYDIDPSQSFLIGDSLRDIEAGNSAGLKQCFKIDSNSSIVNICRQISKM
ncbi:MAG: HAD family hydrolase [Marinilabiliaceae bacterium]|nr:HAD family hydrolase [Marinilabiliaceae bacterium]